MADANTDREKQSALRRNFLSYFGIAPWRRLEKYSAQFTKRLETFGIRAFAKTTTITYQPAEITRLELTQEFLVFELDVKTGEDRARGHEVKIEIPVNGIKLIVAALKFDRAAQEMWSKKPANEEVRKDAP